MVNSRPPQLNLLLRLGAAGCVLLWLVCVTLCDAVHLFEFNHHGAPTSGAQGHRDKTFPHHRDAPSDDAEHSLAEPNHTLDPDEPSPPSHHPDGDDSCCSTIKAPVPSAKPVVVSKPILNPIAILFFLSDPSVTALPAEKEVPLCQAKSRERVSTPEVYLGPAFRSLAPPVFL